MKLYNSLTRKIEEFKPIHDNEVGIYTCGPTAYNYAHIGNLRTYIFEDLLHRVLLYNSYEVKRVMNITDVGHLTADRDMGEDKIEKEAKKEKKTAWEISEFYTEIFKKDMRRLNLLEPQVWCKATDYIPEQIELIKKLEKKGFSYRTSDGIYFDTSKLSDYGKMATVSLEGLREGARIEKNLEKKNPTDFALWKFSPKDKKRDMEWKSPWGIGFPGWHLECSAMSMKYLGETFDLHTGGVDHINVHHTNEIAQSEAATGKKFVNYWLHSEFLLINNGRMGKSQDNFITLSDIEKKGFEALAYRYFVLGVHYRQQLNFTWEGLEGAQRALNNLREIVTNLKLVAKSESSVSPEKVAKMDSYRQRFMDYLNDDLAIPSVLALIWEVVKSQLSASDKLDLILNFDEVLGLKLDEVSQESRASQVPQEIEELAKKREELRKLQKWEEADKIRQEIENLGWQIKDSEKGSQLKPLK